MMRDTGVRLPEGAKLNMIVTNTRNGVETPVEWVGGETFREACRRAGLPAIISFVDHEEEKPNT